jgi:hypothetical protein
MPPTKPLPFHCGRSECRGRTSRCPARSPAANKAPASQDRAACRGWEWARLCSSCHKRRGASHNLCPTPSGSARRRRESHARPPTIRRWAKTPGLCVAKTGSAMRKSDSGGLTPNAGLSGYVTGLGAQIHSDSNSQLWISRGHDGSVEKPLRLGCAAGCGLNAIMERRTGHSEFTPLRARCIDGGDPPSRALETTVAVAAGLGSTGRRFGVSFSSES